MNLYLDSSAWAKTLLDEAGADDVADLWDASDRIFCLSVGRLEVRSAIAGRLGRSAARTAREQLDERWKEVEAIDVDGALIARAAQAIDVHRLRTLDALHLAAALELGDADLVLATWDGQLASAARDEGLATAP